MGNGEVTDNATVMVNAVTLCCGYDFLGYEDKVFFCPVCGRKIIKKMDGEEYGLYERG